MHVLCCCGRAAPAQKAPGHDANVAKRKYIRQARYGETNAGTLGDLRYMNERPQTDRAQKSPRAEKHKGGRPTRLTPELESEILKHAGAGIPIAVMAKILNFDRSNLYDWLSRGRMDIQARKTKTRYARFYDTFTRAEGRVEASHISNIQLAGQKQWQASAHYLACRYPERWSPKQVLEHSGKVDTTVQANVTVGLIPQQMLELLKDPDVAQLADAIVDRLVAKAIESNSSCDGS